MLHFRTNIDSLKAQGNIQGLIRALLHQRRAHVRAAAAEALGQIGDCHAVEPLFTALRDENTTVCAAAAAAIRQIGSRFPISECPDVH